MPEQNKKTQTDKTVKGRCFNCKHASNAFKIGCNTHHQCCHTIHESGFASGELSEYDALKEWHNGKALAREWIFKHKC